MFIELTNVSKIFRNENDLDYQSLRDIDLAIEKGEFVCFLGPSGCGKSTLINLMAGFDFPTTGRILIDGEEVSGPSIRYVTIFQNYGLLPWRNVRKNVALGLESQKLGKRERNERVDELIRRVGLTNFGGYRPHQLSGGMQQRVAIARALAVDPEILFMDEPFGSLDALTRMAMQEEILTLCEAKKTTIVFVTHDVDEAVFLADRIVVMTPDPGRVRKIFRVTLPRRRNRASPDFLKMRDDVIAELDFIKKNCS
ncbi:MAG: ABC transporter ATP-binding protein [Synergistaceae bacterium]|jgi:NitT/TauT family transport system ATP-binding protein|nr:ABC transporter ATP-binding protein [Synergistaceae bacterium]